ncbi:MAG: methyl-accepting chemotaxis protein [Oscillospiraceae bacterium]|nr:methyl-accepting chemotaxis protein [Oscillospiraceae bacterium]
MLKNMKVKKSLLMGFLIVIVISVVIIVVSLLMMVNQKNQYEDLLNQEVAANESILYARLNAVLQGRTVRDILLTPDDPENDTYVDQANEYMDLMYHYVEELKNDYPEGLDKAPLNKYVSAVETWGAIKLLPYYEQYEKTGIEAYLDQAKNVIIEEDNPAMIAMAAAGDELDSFLVQTMDEKVAEIEQSIMTTIIIVIVAMVVAVVVVIIFALTLIKGITNPVEEVRVALNGFSEGNLSIPVNFQSANELGEMCDALRKSQHILSGVIDDEAYLLGEMAKGNFNVQSKDESLYVGALSTALESMHTIMNSLSDALTQIAQSAEQVSAGSEQVSIGSQSLAQGATEQASAVEELSATITEIANAARETAENAEDAQAGVERASFLTRSEPCDPR